MTDKDPGMFPPIDPLDHLEFDTPVEIEDEKGGRWVEINMKAELEEYLRCFQEHLTMLDKLYGEFDETNEKQANTYLAALRRLIATDLNALQLLTNDWIQIRSLPHFLIDEDMHNIDDGVITRGQFLGGMVFPDIEHTEGGVVITQPLAAHFAVAHISTLTGRGDDSFDYGATKENYAVVSLNSPGIELSRLVPLYDEDLPEPGGAPTDYTNN